MKEFVSYTNETPFHGFSFIGRSVGKWELFSWLLTVVFCATIAVQQTVSLVKVYYGEPTDTKTFVNLNTTITLSNPVLCFNTEYADMITPSWQMYTADDISLLESYTTGSIFTAPDRIKDLIKLLFIMYADITRTEVLISHSTKLKLPVVWSNNESVETHKLLMESGRSLADLLKLTATSMCKTMNVSVTFTFLDKWATLEDVTVPYNICQPHLVTHFDDSLICFNILSSNEQLTFFGPHDVLQVMFNSYAWNPNNTVAKQFSIDLAGRSYYNKYGDGGNVLSADYNTFTKASVQLSAEFNSLNLRRKPCSTTISVFECRNTCAGIIGFNMCGCWILYEFIYQPVNVRSCCNTTQSSNTTSNNFMPDYGYCVSASNIIENIPKLIECFAKCINPCRYQQFSFTTENAAVSQVPLGQTVLQLSIRDFTYTGVSEIVTKDWQSFMNEFGGSLGVWLGGSILALIHLPVYIGKLVCLSLKRKPKIRKSSIHQYY